MSLSTQGNGPPKMADDIDPRQQQDKNPLKLLMAMHTKLQCQDSSYKHLHVTIARASYTVFFHKLKHFVLKTSADIILTDI